MTTSHSVFDACKSCAEQFIGERSLVRPPMLVWIRAALGGLIFAVVLGAIYAPILKDLAWDWWNDPNYSHGPLVPIFSGLVVWQRRHALAGVQARGDRLGLLVLLFGVSMLIAGEVGAEYFLTRTSLVVTVAGLVLFHFGADMLRLLAFPLAFLLFMVPLPSILLYAVTFPLQSMAAQNGVWLLDLLGVPVLRDGNVIHLTDLTLGVTEACSGIRSLVSLLAVAIAWGYIALPAWWAMAALAVAALPITIAANAGRIIVTGLVGQWFGTAYASGFFHAFTGWGLFLAAFAGLAGIQALLSWVQRTHRLDAM